MKTKAIGVVMVLLAWVCSQTDMQAQRVEENVPAMVYYMPFTQLKVIVQYDEVEEQVGPFYQYAERYLATQEVVKKNATYYELKGIKTMPVTSADPNRAFTVLPQKGMNMQCLSLTPEGILKGYNLKAEPPMPCPPKREPKSPCCHAENNTLYSTPMPLLEEQLIASSISKMAEGTAKQIYRLREARLNLLSGDVDHLPADGEAMKLTLQEITQREQELTALFVGKRIVTHHKKEVLYTPSDDEQTTLLRFSRLSGPVAEDDLSGEAIVIHQQAVHQYYAVATDKKTTSQPSSICYNLPGEMTYSITRKAEVLAEGKIAVAQWGIAVPLAADILMNGQTSVELDTRTGAILTVKQ